MHFVLVDNQGGTYAHTQDHCAKISPLGHLTQRFLSEKPQKQSHALTQRPNDYQAVRSKTNANTHSCGKKKQNIQA